MPSVNGILSNKTLGSRRGISKLRFDNMSVLLRRDSQRISIGKEHEDLEEGISWNPVAVRKLPRPAGRGVIALLKGMRDMEDEKLDKELKMFWEVEGDCAPRSKAPQLKILVDDDQTLDRFLGPDGEEESEDSEIEKERGKRWQATKGVEEERVEANDEMGVYKTKLRCIANAYLGHMSQGRHVPILEPSDPQTRQATTSL